MRVALRTWRWVAGTDPLGTKVEDTSDNGDEAEDSPGDTDEDPTNDPTETPLAPAAELGGSEDRFQHGLECG